MTARTGEAHGFEWMDFDFRDFPDRMLTNATRGRTGSVRIVSPKGHGPDGYSIAHWLAQAPYFPGVFLPDVGFRPFDEAAEFPESPVTYYRGGFTDFKADEWAMARIGPQEAIEVSFTYERWKQKLHAYARTMKDGAETLVRRKVGSEDVFEREIATILGYFERNCPRIVEGAQKTLVCGTHVNAVLSLLAGEGLRHAGRWLATAHDHPMDSSTSATLPGAMLTGITGATKASLKRGERSGIVQLDVEIWGGHRLTDDEQGTTVRLKAQLPEAVVGALKGRAVTDALDLPWLRGLTIRTARIEDGDVVMRAFAPRSPATLPEQVEDDERVVDERLRALATDRDGLARFDDSVRPLLEGMTPRTLLAVLALLQADGRVTLDQHGFPGWTLRRMGSIVQMESCPTSDMAALVSGRTKRDET